MLEAVAAETKVLVTEEQLPMVVGHIQLQLEMAQQIEVVAEAVEMVVALKLAAMVVLELQSLK
jgi:transcriptional regulator NrdR family protein